MTIRTILKAHVKGHIRTLESGHTIWIPTHETKRPGRAAKLHERTSIGEHKDGSHYLRATDKDDAATIEHYARRLNIKTDKRTRQAEHLGQKGPFVHFHMNQEDAVKLHHALHGAEDAPEEIRNPNLIDMMEAAEPEPEKEKAPLPTTEAVDKSAEKASLFNYTVKRFLHRPGQQGRAALPANVQAHSEEEALNIAEVKGQLEFLKDGESTGFEIDPRYTEPVGEPHPIYDGIPMLTAQQSEPEAVTPPAQEEAPKGKAKEKEGGKGTNAAAVARNLEHMGTPEHEWKAVPIKEMKQVPDDKGKMCTMPEFDFPQGYAKAPTLYPGDTSPCCELCGTPIKNVWHLQNDTKKWTLCVGSECVTHFEEGKSGKALAAEHKAAMNKQAFQQAAEARDALYKGFYKHAGKEGGISGLTAEHNLRRAQSAATWEPYNWQDKDAFKTYRSLHKMTHDNSTGKPVSDNPGTLTRWVEKNGTAAAEHIKLADAILDKNGKKDPEQPAAPENVKKFVQMSNGQWVDDTPPAAPKGSPAPAPIDKPAKPIRKFTAKEKSEMERWLGYLENKAPEGYVYQNAVDKLQGMGVAEHPAFNERMNTAIQNAKNVKAKQEEAKQKKQEDYKTAKQKKQEDYKTDIQEARKGGYPLSGNTFPHKDAIKAAGGKWDGDRKQWILPTMEAFYKLNEKVNGVKPLLKGEARFAMGEGYGGRALAVGTVIKTPKSIREAMPEIGEYSVVTASTKKYFKEDGLTFGVGDESGHIYTHYIRAATEEESAPKRESEAKAEDQKAAKEDLRAMTQDFDQHGEHPEGNGYVPEGTTLLNTGNIYGGGDWWVVGPEFVWHVRNNGADGDDWRGNNVKTGGAGGIGSRKPFTPELAEKLLDLDARINDLQPGETRVINGKTYILNSNHRWQRQDGDNPTPPSGPEGGGNTPSVEESAPGAP